jgi:CheY-like chemotaxis protein
LNELNGQPLIPKQAAIYFPNSIFRLRIAAINNRDFMIEKTRKSFTIFLADDDADDRFLFQEAVAESENILLTTMKDGLELMRKLTNGPGRLPDAIFLDLNMPFKNGHECLREIKDNAALKNIPVVIYSTSTNRMQIESVYKDGANLYIPKPDSFSKLKSIIQKIFTLDWQEYTPQPAKENFVLTFQ